MASWIAERIAQMLVTSSLIEEGDRELYSYGFFMLISRIYFFLVTVITGLLMRIPVESALFYVMFTLLRSYAGGMHAKTENMCTILTTLSLLTSICGIKGLNFVQREMSALIIAGIGAGCIIAFCPLDTAEKPLESADRNHYRHTSITIVVTYLALALLMYAMGLKGVLNAVAVSIALESALLISGKMMQLR